MIENVIVIIIIKKNGIAFVLFCYTTALLFCIPNPVVFTLPKHSLFLQVRYAIHRQQKEFCWVFQYNNKTNKCAHQKGNVNTDALRMKSINLSIIT